MYAVFLFIALAATTACATGVYVGVCPDTVCRLCCDNATGIQYNLAATRATMTNHRVMHERAIVTEGFDGPAVPLNWVEVRNSNPPGTTGVFKGDPSVFAALTGATDSYTAMNFNSAAGTGTISTWLISPQVTLGTGSIISFWTRTVSTPSFADRLQLRLSTNGPSANVGSTEFSVGDFTTLLVDVNPGLTVAGYPNGWTQFSVTLAAPLPAMFSGRFAFRYFVTDGGPSGSNSDYIGIDGVAWSTPSGPTTTE